MRVQVGEGRLEVLQRSPICVAIQTGQPGVFQLGLNEPQIPFGVIQVPLNPRCPQFQKTRELLRGCSVLGNKAIGVLL